MRIAAALLALFLLAGTARAEKSVADLVREFVVPATRSGALAELRRRKDPKAIPLIRDALPDTDWVTQLYGAILIYEQKSELGKAALRKLTSARPPFLRFIAGYYLYRSGEKGAALAMADALADPAATTAIRYQMLVRAGGVPDPVVDAGIAGLVTAEPDPLVQCYALYLMSVDRFERYARYAEKSLLSEQPQVRALAAALLFRYGFEEHARVLAREILDAKIPAADWGRLSVILTRSPRPGKEWLDAIGERVKVETDAKIATCELKLLTRHPHVPAREAVSSRIRDADETVAKAAFAALAAIPGALPPEKLLPLLEEKKDALRLRAADLLRRRDDRSGLVTVISILGKGSAADRAEAARVLGGFVVAAAVDPLIGALADRETAVREAAEASLVEVLGKLLPYRPVNLKRAGYNPRMTPEALPAAIEKIRHWWAEARARDW